VDGVLYRPAQDCASTYGGAITINRIESLSPERFEEVPVASVEPDPDSAFPDGVHTLVVGDRRVYIDGKRTRLRADLVLTQLCRRLARRRTVATTPPVGFGASGWATAHQVRS
jgi:hypothetical protein